MGRGRAWTCGHVPHPQLALFIFIVGCLGRLQTGKSGCASSRMLDMRPRHRL